MSRRIGLLPDARGCSRCGNLPAARERAKGGPRPEKGSAPPFAVHGSAVKAKASRATHSRRVGVIATLGLPALRPAQPRSPSPSRGPSPATPPWKPKSGPRSSRFRSPSACTCGTGPWTRFAKLLVLAGFAWSLTTLAQSSNDVLYSAGRVFGWLVEPFLIFLVLAFPIRPADGSARARPGRGQPVARRSPLPADDAARGLLPDAFSVDAVVAATARPTPSWCSAPSPASWTP